MSYQGILYVAGTYFSGGSPIPGYPQYSEPFVRTSADGGPWKPVGPPSGGVVVGTGADQHLLSTPIGLFLFAGGTPGSAVWRLASGSSFERVSIPSLMAGAAVDEAAWNKGRLVVIESDKYAAGVKCLHRPHNEGRATRRQRPKCRGV